MRRNFLYCTELQHSRSAKSLHYWLPVAFASFIGTVWIQLYNMNLKCLYLSRRLHRLFVHFFVLHNTKCFFYILVICWWFLHKFACSVLSAQVIFYCCVVPIGWPETKWNIFCFYFCCTMYIACTCTSHIFGTLTWWRNC